MAWNTPLGSAPHATLIAARDLDARVGCASASLKFVRFPLTRGARALRELGCASDSLRGCNGRRTRDTGTTVSNRAIRQVL